MIHVILSDIRTALSLGGYDLDDVNLILTLIKRTVADRKDKEVCWAKESGTMCPMSCPAREVRSISLCQQMIMNNDCWNDNEKSRETIINRILKKRK